MKHLRHLLVLLMVLALALPMLVACNNQPANSTDTSSAGTQNDTSVPGDESEVNNDVPPEIVELNREIKILCWDWSAGSASIKGYTGEVISNAEGEASRVDVAKKAVRDAVEDEYKVTITGQVTNKQSFLDDVKQMVTTGTYECDIVFASGHYAQNFARSSALTDLKTIETIHFENSWWDQNCVNDVSVGGRLFWACGDINTYDNLGTWCVLFNKKLKADLAIPDDFYQKAKDGEWTLDYFMEICEGVTQEYDGKSGIDENDLWAVGTEKFNVFAQVVGGGVHAISKDENDMPYLTVETATERTYAALDKIVNFYLSDEVMVADGGKFDGKGYSNVWEATVHKAFIEGRELFYICGLINVAGFREMDDEFGILPMPKTFADQDNYYHTVSPGNSSYLMIPYGVSNPDELGLVIEALAMRSQEMVTPEFYEMQLKGRDTRDDESADMLDIIFATRSFDLGPIYNWGEIMNCYYTIDTNYASRFDSLSDAATIAIEDFITLMEEYVDAE
ncbi:MAG: hypothetical protein IIW19_05135 [Clostridia bacterium]|nr:hypothetical protein [Clostridia bacterium]